MTNDDDNASAATAVPASPSVHESPAGVATGAASTRPAQSAVGAYLAVALHVGVAGASLFAVRALTSAACDFHRFAFDVTHPTPITAGMLDCLRGFAFVAIAAAFTFGIKRLRPVAIVRVFAAIVVLAVGITDYLGSLEPRDVAYSFFGLRTGAPSTIRTDERYPDRPAYRTNRWGLRDTEFPIAKPAGHTRIALIGDSYMFGLGVRDPQTIPARIAAHFRERGLESRVEVLNLGVPGNNLTSYVKMYEIARQRLDADVFVIGLVPNHDFRVFDWQNQRRDLSRVSAYSLASYLFGFGSVTYAIMVMSLDRNEPGWMARRLNEQLAPFDAVRAHDGARPVVFLLFSDDGNTLAPALSRRPGVSLIPYPHVRADHFIPNDGHPSALGDATFARLVIDRLEALDGYPFSRNASP